MGSTKVRRAALVECEAMAPGWERRREYLREFSQGSRIGWSPDSTRGRARRAGVLTIDDDYSPWL